MARVSLKRIFRPLLWLLWLVLLSTVVPLLLVATAPIFIVIWGVGMIAALVSPSLGEGLGVTRLGMVLWLGLWALLIVGSAAPAVALAHAAALWLDGQTPSLLPAYLDLLLRQLPRDARELVSELNLSRQDWGWFCVITGMTGFSSNLVYSLIDVPWRLKQLRLVKALPRSKARSAAVGLAEFEGIARQVTYAPRDHQSREMELQPFYLEDETGRIRVDPRGVAVRPPGTYGMALHANDVAHDIRDGDRVYVIGHVQPRVDGPAEAPWRDGLLVVRPLNQALVASPVARLLFSKDNVVADRDTPNIFFVDKGPERNVAVRQRMALWDFCAIGAVYLASSLWLVQAAWPWLTLR